MAYGVGASRAESTSAVPSPRNSHVKFTSFEPRENAAHLRFFERVSRKTLREWLPNHLVSTIVLISRWRAMWQDRVESLAQPIRSAVSFAAASGPVRRRNPNPVAIEIDALRAFATPAFRVAAGPRRACRTSRAKGRLATSRAAISAADGPSSTTISSCCSPDGVGGKHTRTFSARVRTVASRNDHQDHRLGDVTVFDCL